MTTDGRQENEERFRLWVDQHRGILAKIARSFAREVADRDDLYQELLLQLWTSMPRYDGTSKASTWIYRVALNRAISWSRKQSGWDQLWDREIDVERVPASAADETDEDLHRLYRAIHQLDPIDRSLILLHLEGVSYQDIGEAMGMTANNVGVRLHRLRQRLTRRMGGND